MLPSSFTDWVMLFCGQAALGLLWDRAVGDPHELPHPARWIGRWISLQEEVYRRYFRNLPLAGVLLCGVTVLSAAFGAFLALILCAVIDRITGGLGSGGPLMLLLGGGVLNGVWFSFRSLSDEAEKVRLLLEQGDLTGARQALSMIVGRDTENLTEVEIARACVETVAENTVDGGLSPLFWSLLGGPVAVSFFKAASTLDSMVGYRNERYEKLGTASARLDDLLNYLPARCSLLLIPCAAALSGLHAVSAWRLGRRDGHKHPSPNSAIGESAFAGALGVQLGGPSSYEGRPSMKPFLGDPCEELTQQTISRANGLLLALWTLGLAFSSACVVILMG